MREEVGNLFFVVFSLGAWSVSRVSQPVRKRTGSVPEEGVWAKLVKVKAELSLAKVRCPLSRW